MAITFNFEVNNKPNKKGFYVVLIRVTQDRKKKRLKTSIELRRLSDWNKEKQCVRASEPNAKAWNIALERELEKAKATYRELNAEGMATSANIIKKLKDQDEKPTLLAYSKKVHDSLLAAGQLGNWQKYGTFIKTLERFLTKKGVLEDVPFREVTPEFVDSFKAYLSTLQNNRAKRDDKGQKMEMHLHPNTIAKLLKIFRAIVNKAMNIEGYLKLEDNPFRSCKIKEIPIAKERLEKHELEAVLNLPLEPYSPKWHARNAFFFSYYCAGIRAGDMMQLRWCNISAGRLSYQMGKNHKIKDVLLVEPAREILELYMKENQKQTDYIFPYLNSRAPYARAVAQEEKDSMPVDLKQELLADIHRKNIQINRRLKGILAMAGIEKEISFHISRHTFAKQAKLAGTDNAILKGMLAHSSLNVTERYMGEFDTAREDEALEHIFKSSTEQAPATISKEAIIQALNRMDEATLAEVLAGLKK